MRPRQLGSYTLLEPIGQGGTAIVYRARHASLERTVAVKVLLDDLAASDAAVERFRRDARAAASLRHPNVIVVHDLAADQRGRPYVVLDYLDGPSLAAMMDAGLDDACVPGLLDQIAAGLDCAHTHGVIHGDLTPTNLLLTATGRLVLADFSSAWPIEPRAGSRGSGMIGTPAYMAPELAGGAQPDRLSDVYSLGVVVYEMLVGDLPCAAETPLAMLIERVYQAAPSVRAARPDLSPAVAEVVARALARAPAERYATAGALARAFRRAFSAGWRRRAA